MGWVIIGRRARRHNGTTLGLWQVVTKTYCVVIYLSRLLRTALTRLQMRAGDRFRYQFGELEEWGLAGEVPPEEILKKIKDSHLAAISAYHGMQPSIEQGVAQRHIVPTAALLVVLSWSNLYPTVMQRRLLVSVLSC